jgi:hypothetical protein
MTRKNVYRGFITGGLLFMLGVAATAEAECVVVSNPDIREGFRQSDLVFSGVITKVDFNDRLLFQVDRVWKGPVARTILIYQLDGPFVGSYMFRPNTDVKYIIFAKALSPDDRKVQKADEPSAFGIHSSCSVPRWARQQERKLNEITRAKKPRR